MPKRKAVSKPSGLMNGAADDDGFLSGADNTTVEDADTAPPPAKRSRGRPKVTAPKATKAKTITRKPRSTVVVGPKRRGAKAGQRKSIENAKTADVSEAHIFRENDRSDERDDHELSEDELESPGITAPPLQPKHAIKVGARRGRKREPEMTAVKDGEFEYTPTVTRRDKPATSSSQRGKPSAAAQRKPAPEEQLVVEHEDEGALGDTDGTELSEDGGRKSSHSISSHIDKLLKALAARPPPTTPNQKQKTGSRPDTGNAANEVMLRRKLGETTKKLESMEAKYRRLREVGIVEANANSEKLRKQCETLTATSNALITSLKKELAAQTDLANESQTLKNRLFERDEEVSILKMQVGRMTSDLSNAQNEIKALQSKLTVARNATTNAEQPKVPGSAGKGASSSRGAMTANAESAQPLQIAQLKEDLYSDLTGLIIRDVKRRDVDYLYDCIQTGFNGTLHFKLAVADDTDNKVTTDLEAAEFQYMPLLDDNRDRKLIEILPDYLAVDITFSRQHASKFYSRVVDTLTKRRADDK
ncbi:hypothetical protein PRK78_004811 [Emydomyces testavorans]|uniref:Monopolin complex subunit Csm1/Pcs1 C-terminal domain-containing protein n=1 Tax=Emydomyces testavorans TaxID=2070801 RepID=A0AAF0DID0_9EURO|nr:hypothetical protein PRK78_004811 [Emydomyces testavorans]